MGQGWWEVGDFGRYGVLAEGTDFCIHYHDYASTEEDMTEALLASGIVCMLLFCAGTQMCGGHCVGVLCRNTDVWWSLCCCFVQEHRCVVVTVCVDVLCRNTDV